MVSVKHCILFLLLAGIFAQINCVAVYYGLFAMNRKAIAAKACEKKVKGCCGRCFLNKKLASVDDGRQEPVDKAASGKPQSSFPDPMPGLEPCCHSLPLPGMKFVTVFAIRATALAEGMYPRIEQPPELHAAYTAG